MDFKSALSGLGTVLTGTSMGMQGRGAEFAQGLAAQDEAERQRRARAQQYMLQGRAVTSRVVLQSLKAGQPDQAFQFLSNVISEGRASGDLQGEDLQDALSLASMIHGEQYKEAIDILTPMDRYYQGKGLLPDLSKKSDMTAGEREFSALTKGMSDKDVERARRIKLGLEGRESSRLTPEQEAEIARMKATGRQEGGDIASRRQGFIDSGIQAADGSIVVRRAIDLLDKVKTGGIDKALLDAKKVFGVEGADEAELSANLGKSVLSQLRDVFGAAFTEKEGQRLERIEAGFGKSTEGNKRLLNQVLKIMQRKVKRGMKAARDSDDDISLDEMRSAMKFNLSDEPTNNKLIEEQQPATQGIKFLGFE